MHFWFGRGRHRYELRLFRWHLGLLEAAALYHGALALVSGAVQGVGAAREAHFDRQSHVTGKAELDLVGLEQGNDEVNGGERQTGFGIDGL